MLDNTKYLGLRVPTEIAEKIKECADSQGLSISDLMRQAIDVVLENRKQSSHKSASGVSEMLEEVRLSLKTFQEQLQAKDQQISQLHQLLALSEKAFERAQLQLEDLRKRQSVWQRIKAVFVSEAL